ncbi:MAG: YhcH/YjgK/YiaL family protein [Christensenellales bacterium]
MAHFVGPKYPKCHCHAALTYITTKHILNESNHQLTGGVMIADTLDRLHFYLGLNPNLDLVIKALKTLDLDSLPDGRHAISGDNAFLNLMHTSLDAGGTWEAHREYIDLQLVLLHEETIAWAPIEQIKGFGTWDAQKDIMLSTDPYQGSRLNLKTGMFALFFPEDAHQPCIGQKQGRKAVFKIKVKPPASSSQNMMNHKGTLPLSSKRLLLRPYTAGDAQAMFDNWCSDPEVAKTVTWTPHPDVEFTRQLLSDWIKSYQHPFFYHWGIELDGKLIGDISTVSHNEQQMTCEVGYCLSRAYWNRGIMTEALERVLQFLFTEVGYRRIVLRHLASNPASGRVIQKAGLKREGIQRQMIKNKQGVFEDVVCYAALRNEWIAPSALH